MNDIRARKYEYETLLWVESCDIASFLDQLGDADFDEDCLCEGWRVRDVVSHMIVGHDTTMLRMVGLLARYGFNVPKGSRHGSVAYGSAHSPDEIRAAWRNIAEGHVRAGISKRMSTEELFVDHMIHHQDIRRPLTAPRTIPDERLVAALDVMPTLGGFVKSKQRMKGLRWTATDVDWTFGSGPDVTGPAEALILLSSGRPAPIVEVEGDGVSTLRERLAA
jgi:uncharacterized protein (TIGR03083 family)